MAGSMWPWWPKAWNPFTRWSWSNTFDYETILDALEKEIRTTESTLVDIRARKRRAIHNVLQIMITLWIVSLIVLWICSSFFWGREWAASRSLVVVVLLLGTPLFIAVLHRLVSIWFRRLERAQETHLNTLRKQKREKINEIKKATDFDHLNNLLERYDEEKQRPQLNPPSIQPRFETSSKPLRRSSTLSLRRHASSDTLQNSSKGSNPSDEQRTGQLELLKSLAPPISGLPVLGVPSAQGNTESRPYRTPSPQPPYPRGWMDKLADMILGTDPYGATPEDQQYALICRHCFRHNGLVPKNELHEIRMYDRIHSTFTHTSTEYICPSCHKLNSRRPSSRPVSSPFVRERRQFTPADDKRASLPAQSMSASRLTDYLHWPSQDSLRRSSHFRTHSKDERPKVPREGQSDTDDMQLDEE